MHTTRTQAAADQLVGASELPPLATILDWATYVLFIVGLLTVLYGGLRVSAGNFNGYTDDEEAGRGIMAGGGGLMLILPAKYMLLFVGFDPAGTDEAADSEAAPEPAAPAPVVDTPAPADDSHAAALTLLVDLVEAAAVIAALALVGVVAALVRSKIADRKKAQRTLESDFAAARAIYLQVADAYAAYLADPYSIFTRPLLDDVTEPRTAAFITAFTDANAHNTDTCPDTRSHVNAFANAARAALAAWNTADQYARALGMGVRTEDDKRTVRRLRNSLYLALDDSAPAGEREAAMATVERLADGFITVPDRVYARAKTAIETTTRKQLTS